MKESCKKLRLKYFWDGAPRFMKMPPPLSVCVGGIDKQFKKSISEFASLCNNGSLNLCNSPPKTTNKQTNKQKGVWLKVDFKITVSKVNGNEGSKIND